MIRGKLGPEPLRYYVQPGFAYLGYEEIRKDPFPTPQEAQVKLRIGDNYERAFVPLSIVDEENGTVKATLFGEVEGKIFVSFPPTNFGQTRFLASEEDLVKIEKSPAGDQ